MINPIPFCWKHEWGCRKNDGDREEHWRNQWDRCLVEKFCHFLPLTSATTCKVLWASYCLQENVGSGRKMSFYFNGVRTAIAIFFNCPSTMEIVCLGHFAELLSVPPFPSLTTCSNPYRAFCNKSPNRVSSRAPILSIALTSGHLRWRRKGISSSRLASFPSSSIFFQFILLEPFSTTMSS